MSEVSEALDALQRGERTLEDVEELFLTRKWPLHGAEQDTDSPPEGSFVELANAYSTRTITLDQYVILAAAASDAMNQQQANTPTSDEVNQ